jgi:hypothetical protein
MIAIVVYDARNSSLESQNNTYEELVLAPPVAAKKALPLAPSQARAHKKALPATPSSMGADDGGSEFMSMRVTPDSQRCEFRSAAHDCSQFV